MEKEKPKVSLLLLNLGRKQMMNYVLENLLSKIGDIDYEILTLDQGGEMLTLQEPYHKKHSPFTIIDGNIGIAAGFNKLLREAQGDLVIIGCLI